MHGSCSCSCRNRHDLIFFGFLAFVIGGVLLLQNFGTIPDDTWNYFWPLVIVITGLKLMVSGSSCCRSGDCQMPKESMASDKPAPKRKSPKKRGTKKK